MRLNHRTNPANKLGQTQKRTTTTTTTTTTTAAATTKKREKNTSNSNQFHQRKPETITQTEINGGGALAQL